MRIAQATRMAGAAALLFLLGAGCARDTAPRTTYYQLARHLPPSIGDPTMPVLALVPLSSAIGLDRQELRRLEGPVTVHYDTAARWVALPSEVVTHALATRLMASGRLQQVQLFSGARQADLVLEGSLLALEGWRQKAGAPCQARLALALTALSPQGRKSVWRHSYDQTAPCLHDDAPGVVTALADLLDAALDAALPALLEAAEAAARREQ